MEPNLSPSIRWGGRAHRYAKNSGKAIRIIDPISGRPQEFGLEIVYEAWLLHRFNSHVNSIGVGFQAGVASKFCKTDLQCIQLDVIYKSGERLLEAISRKGPTGSQIARLKSVASRLGAQYGVRNLEQIREATTQIQGLRHLRQAMQSHTASREFPDLMRFIKSRASVKRREITLSPTWPDAYIDAGLGFLHCAGLIEIELGVELYGPHTNIKAK